jgi:hypothetical protein
VSDRTGVLIVVALIVVALAVLDARLRRELARHLVDPGEARFRGWRNLTYLEPALYTPSGRVWLRRLWWVKLAEVLLVVVAGLLLAPAIWDCLTRTCD